MRPNSITPENTVFAVLSFEGPDVYSLAGGLGARVTNLAETLAQLGFVTHLFFVGDCRKANEEAVGGGKLILHRWCQWISEYHPLGVYQGEREKLFDFNRSLPGYLRENVVKPAAREGKMVIVLGEEWHTAEAICLVGDELRGAGLTDRAVMLWNANNTFGFENIDWRRLTRASTLTTVSRYMRNIMRGMGLNPLIIPNGIPGSLLGEVDGRASASLRTDLATDLVLSKVARWDPSKGWDAALDATARLKDGGASVVLLARGGAESYGEEVMERAHALGLRVRDVGGQGGVIGDHDAGLSSAGGVDILNLKSYCPQSFLRLLYHASDAVLANSCHEPFGLVGLETMAAGGVAFTGGTGEDYAIPFQNSIVLQTTDPKEIEAYVLFLKHHPGTAERIRRAGRYTAREYTWEHVIQILVRKLEYQARSQGMLAASPSARKLKSVGPTEEALDHLVPCGMLSSGMASRWSGGYRAEFAEVYRLVRHLKQERTVRSRVRRLLADVPLECAFRCHDGGVFFSLRDLAGAFYRMSDDVYAYHADAVHNDFSQWISDVIGDDKLAGDLRRARDRVQAAAIVAQRIGAVVSHQPDRALKV